MEGVFSVLEQMEVVSSLLEEMVLAPVCSPPCPVQDLISELQLVLAPVQEHLQRQELLLKVSSSNNTGTLTETGTHTEGKF